MSIVGVGIDLVSIPDFAEQVDQPGTVFSETFTPGERRDASDKSSSAARHLAARWAAKHVVAEVSIDGRWVVADPTFRTFLKDSQGRLLTSKDLQNPEIFREATRSIPNYLPAYSYESLASVRTAAIPYVGTAVRHLLDGAVPAWDDSLDWSLLFERRSFKYFFLAVDALIALLLARIVIAWLADHRFRVPRFRLRANLSRATAVFFTTPGIK